MMLLQDQFDAKATAARRRLQNAFDGETAFRAYRVEMDAALAEWKQARDEERR